MFPKNKGPVLGVPMLYKDHNMLGSMFGPPMYGNPQVSRALSFQSLKGLKDLTGSGHHLRASVPRHLAGSNK